MPYTAQGVGYRNMDTSQEAAEAAEGTSSLWRLMVLQDLSMHGPSTADEVAARLNQSVLKIRPRVSELRNQRKIIDTGTRRRNATGKSAAVWTINTQERTDA